MIVGAAVCPGAPFLIRGTADGIAAQLDAVVTACSVAVARLTGADAVLLITAAAGPVGGRDQPAWRELPPGTVISTTSVRRSDRPDGPAVALAGVSHQQSQSVAVPGFTIPAVGTVVGAALLGSTLPGLHRRPTDSDGPASQRLFPQSDNPPTTAIEITGDPAEVAGMLAGRAQSTERLALLVIADGSACHGDDAPGRRDDRASAFDASLAEALAAGNPTALRTASADRALGRALLASVDPLTVLALLTEQRPPTSADLLYAGAPVGVGYLVASWCWGTG